MTDAASRATRHAVAESRSRPSEHPDLRFAILGCAEASPGSTVMVCGRHGSGGESTARPRFIGCGSLAFVRAHGDAMREAVAREGWAARADGSRTGGGLRGAFGVVMYGRMGGVSSEAKRAAPMPEVGRSQYCSSSEWRESVDPSSVWSEPMGERRVWVRPWEARRPSSLMM